MRIIAGRFRRRRLLARPGDVTRPITDRVKEQFFAHCEQRVVGARVADIFAGTGTIGLEALSRGAASVVFIEQDRLSAELLRKNIAALGADDQAFCWQTDALASSFRPRGKAAEWLPYELIFVDPPYRMIPKLRSGSRLYKSLQRLARPEVAAENARLVLRTPEHVQFEMPALWDLDWQLANSGMTMHVYSLQPREAAVEAADPTDGPTQGEPA